MDLAFRLHKVLRKGTTSYRDRNREAVGDKHIERTRNNGTIRELLLRTAREVLKKS